MSLVTRKLGKWVCWEIPTEARDRRIIEEEAGRTHVGVGVWREQWEGFRSCPFPSGLVGELQLDADELLEEAVNLGYKAVPHSLLAVITKDRRASHFPPH